MKQALVAFTILLAAIFTLPELLPVQAQCGGLTFPGLQTVFGPVKGCNFENPAGFISAFLPAVLGILGFITAIIIVISGIQFILSSGNPEGAAAARGRLTFAIIGFIIIVLAFAILQIINRLFLGPTGVT